MKHTNYIIEDYMRDRIDGLQSLRAVASMLVVIDHIITQLLYYKTYGLC